MEAVKLLMISCIQAVKLPSLLVDFVCISYLSVQNFPNSLLFMILLWFIVSMRSSSMTPGETKISQQTKQLNISGARYQFYGVHRHRPNIYKSELSDVFTVLTQVSCLPEEQPTELSDAYIVLTQVSCIPEEQPKESSAVRCLHISYSSLLHTRGAA